MRHKTKSPDIQVLATARRSGRCAPVDRGSMYQHGLGLPAAIFVITLMVSIAAAINLLVSQNSDTFEEETQLTRAFYAAESGAGFAMNALFPPDEFPLYDDNAICPNNVANPRIYNFAVAGLASCRAEVSCKLDATVPPVGGTKYYTISSKGICGEVSRTVQVRTSF
jgi:MSHA biogenesis protein MshP